MKNLNKKVSSVLTGVAGEYFVAAELSRRGAIATITAKNTPHFDVIATDLQGKRSASIQVKATAKNIGGLPIGNKPLDVSPSDNSFYVFAYFGREDQPQYWIVPQALANKKIEKAWSSWVNQNPETRKTAPRTFRWSWLIEDVLFTPFKDNWNVLNIF